MGPVDVALALGCLLVSQQEVWFQAARFSHRTGPRPVEALVYAVASVALCWRRRHPLGVVVVVTGASAAFELAYSSPDGLGSLLPVALALYAAGRYARPAEFAVAATVTAAGVVVHEMRDTQFVLDGQAVLAWGLIAVAGTVGQALALTDVRLEAVRREADVVRRESDAAREGAVVAERARIARDLHDLVGHGLSLIVLQLAALTAERDGGSTPAERKRLRTLDSVARATLTEMRRLVSAAEPASSEPLAPQPRLRDLPALVDNVRRCGFVVDLAIEEEAERLPAGVAVTLFRVAQEALTNVVRHAPAGSAVTGGLWCDHGAARLRIVSEDPGRGGARPEGRGLTGMRERVGLYGGTVAAGPDGEGRFVVEACLPLVPEESTS